MIDNKKEEADCEIGYTNLNIALSNYFAMMQKYLNFAALGKLQSPLNLKL